MTTSGSMNDKLLLMLAMLALVETSPAHAQEAGANDSESAAAEKIDTIVVAGQRRLSRDPKDAKMASLSVQDSVGALEIKQLSDYTLADALTRVSGVVAQRGFQTQRSWYVAIRGLDGNYNSVDIDGGMFIDSTRNDRAAYLDTVPASAINEVVVNKTVTPDMDPNSIGGHISILTLRAFDLSGQPLLRGDATVNVFAQDGAPRSHGPRGAASVVGKRTFGADDNFGVVFAVSANDDRTSEIYNNAGTYSVVNGVDIPAGAQEHGNFDIHDHGYSLLGKLEARSDDRLYAFGAANFFSKDIDQRNYRGGLSLATATLANPSEGSGSFTGATAQAYSREYDIRRQVLTLTTGVDYAVTDRSKASVIASLGDSKHDETLWQGSMFRFSGVDGTYAIGSTGAAFELQPTPGLDVPENWAVTPSAAAVITHLPMTDRVYTFRADYNHNNFPFSEGLGFATGISLRRLHRVFEQSADNFTLPAGTVYTLDQALVDGGTPSSFNGSGIVYVDFDKYWRYTQANGINRPTTTPTSSFNLTEDVLGVYDSLYFSTDQLELLAGVRYEYTGENDDTAQLQGTTPVPFHFTRHYDYFLPNLQGSYEPIEGLRLRTSYTHTIARPTFTTFAQGLTINNFSSLTPFVRGSNADLEARLSRNVDLSADLYRPGGYLSLALFHKNIRNEVYFLTRVLNDATTGVVTQSVTPENAGHSSLAGVELSGEWHSFADITPLLEGVAVRANYTWLRGRLGIVNSDGSTRTIEALNQQPRYEGNLILAYDRARFSGSVSWSLRGRAFNGGVGTTAAGDTYIASRNSLDLRVGYRPIDRVETFVAARNLTRSWWREQTGVDGRQLVTAIQDGVAVQVGLRCEF